MTIKIDDSTSWDDLAEAYCNLVSQAKEIDDNLVIVRQALADRLDGEKRYRTVKSLARSLGISRQALYKFDTTGER